MHLTGSGVLGTGPFQEGQGSQRIDSADGTSNPTEFFFPTEFF